MLELLLLRHAKSSWDARGAEDHDRDLAPRGRKAAPRIGRLMREKGLVPDLALCSTAVRARRTWELAVLALGRDVPTRHLRALYLAEAGAMLRLVREQDPTVRRLLLVGHDPGMHALALLLAGTGPEADLAELASRFPTGALAQLAFAAESWSGVSEGGGELLGFWRPRELD